MGSAFIVASSTETTLYLRKAPYYLGCYAPSDGDFGHDCFRPIAGTAGLAQNQS